MKHSRRKFIAATGAAIGGTAIGTDAFARAPWEKLTELFLKSRLARADEGPLDRYYLGIALFGAPNRWIFDQLLSPKGEAIEPNGMVKTVFTGAPGGYFDTAYATIPYRGLQVPPLWGSTVASPGSMRAMSALLDNMLVIRGYGSGVDGHVTNSIRQFAPVGSAESLSGYLADNTQRLLRTIQYPAFVANVTGFNSHRGFSAVSAYPVDQASNLVGSVLRPFMKRPDAAHTTNLRERYKDLMEAASSVLSEGHRDRFPGIDAVSADRDEALKRLRVGFDDLEAAWPSLFGKYLEITRRSLRDRTAAGFTDRPIIAQDDGAFPESRYSTSANGLAYLPTPGSDLRDWMNGGECLILAQSLALAEFAFTRGLASAIEISNLEIKRIAGSFIANSSGSIGGPTAVTFDQVFDEHQTGVMPSIFLNACFYRALAAGLLELIDRLKERKLFGKTMIHLTSEFGRLPRNTGGGSDHGFDSMVSSLITGALTSGPMVVGNIRRSGSGGQHPPVYSGTFGFRAPTLVAGQETMLNPAHVAATIAELMGYPSNPWDTQGTPLVKVKNGVVEAVASAEVR